MFTRRPGFLFAAILQFAAIVLSASAARAVQDERQPPTLPDPPAAEPESPTPPAPQVVHSRTLPNGVRVLTQPIDGATHAAILVSFSAGSSHDPADAPGLARLLDRLLITAADEAEQGRTDAQLDERYPDGWIVRSYDALSVCGVVVAADRAADEVERLARRLLTLRIDDVALAREVKAIEAEMNVLFEERPLLKPMSWLVAKAFRHDSGAPRGIDPVRLARLTPDRVQREWQQRLVGGNVTVVLAGDVSRIGLDATVDRALGALPSGSRPDFPVTVHPVGAVTRDIMDSGDLPSRRHHGTAAFFAPPVTHPDHPAFLVLGTTLTHYAATLPGAESRLDFQYNMLLDPRAAYLTPHMWRFTRDGGPAAALGWWDAHIKKSRKFTQADARRTLGALDWQLGAPLRGGVIDELGKRPALLYTIAFATAYRSHYGDEAFWQNYRQQLERMDVRDLNAARDTYFADSNRAIFILKGD
ncbi:MAG: insulinase family protein [Phycisphaerales bacterium]|nr:insulinase family protein [Phycisphaerales bacterium]